MTLSNRLRTSLAVVLLAMASSPASAGQFSMMLNGKSFHVDSEYSWNEDNRGIGFEYDFTGDSRWIKSGLVNGFRDSLNNMSYMAGAGLRRRVFQSDSLAGLYFDAGVVAFLMVREDINNREPFPGVLPVVTAGNRHIGLNLTYIPKMLVHDFAHADRVDPNIGGVFFLQAKITLGFNRD